ncbi:MAG: right-handed parallel beta-helix repeat-containing protein [Planctomycetota bacterium]|jgi:hypothetical protein
MLSSTNLTISLVISLFLLGVHCTIAGAEVIYVDGGSHGANDGSSWEDAFNYLGDGLAAAGSGIEILVGSGIYEPDANSVNPGGSGYRHASFQLKNGVTIKGGYAGVGAPDPNERNIRLYETVLSGDLNGNDGPGFANNAENSYHVVVGSGTDDTAVLDGFTITGGNADGASPNNKGGGMYNEWGWPTVTNCTFILNSAGYCGGGMYNYFSGVITISGCMFRDNSASYDGGAIFNWISLPILSNCVFIGNTAGGNGGGMFTNHSSATLSNCTFSENLADNYGGGIFNAKLYGESVLTNCIFWGNVAEEGPQIGLGKIVMGGAETFLSYCDIQGGHLDVYDPCEMLNWCEGNIDSDPLFADEAGGDYHLQSSAGRWDPNQNEWVIDSNTSRCIDAGNPGSSLGNEAVSVNNVRINIGAYGGTAEASMPPYDWALLSDITNDGRVDFVDYAHFAAIYSDEGDELYCDFDRDGDADLSDLGLLIDDWLEKTIWNGL